MSPWSDTSYSARVSYNCWGSGCDAGVSGSAGLLACVLTYISDEFVTRFPEFKLVFSSGIDITGMCVDEASSSLEILHSGP